MQLNWPIGTHTSRSSGTTHRLPFYPAICGGRTNFIRNTMNEWVQREREIISYEITIQFREAIVCKRLRSQCRIVQNRTCWVCAIFHRGRERGSGRTMGQWPLYRSNCIAKSQYKIYIDQSVDISTFIAQCTPRSTSYTFRTGFIALHCTHCV